MVKSRGEQVKTSWASAVIRKPWVLGVALLALFGLWVVHVFTGGTYKFPPRGADAQISALREEVAADLRRAEASHPELPPGESARQESQALTRTKLAQLHGKEREEAMATWFLTYYYQATVVRLAYCQGLGVDITPYTTVFGQRYMKWYARAGRTLADAELTEPALRRQLVERPDGMRPVFDKAVRDWFEQSARATGMAPRQLCEGLRERPEVANRVDELADTNPPLREALSAWD